MGRDRHALAADRQRVRQLVAELGRVDLVLGPVAGAGMELHVPAPVAPVREVCQAVAVEVDMARGLGLVVPPMLAEIAAALADPGAGGAKDLGVVKQFVCPVIKL